MINLNIVDKIEITSLQDNYTDLTLMDDNDLITRGGYSESGGVKQPVLAEHGFSLFIRTRKAQQERSIIFDFGFSMSGAAHNARTLGIDLREAESLVLSHGHGDHWGGLRGIMKAAAHKRLPLIAHPGVFKHSRYTRKQGKIYYMPALTRKFIKETGVGMVETEGPYEILGGNVLFLGEIERVTDFEGHAADAFHRENDVEKRDAFEDDSAIVMHLKGKGLVILSGCAHAGIINIVHYARKLTGINRIHAVMGGFHLSGQENRNQAVLTVRELQRLCPDYVVPTHCTGRWTKQYMETNMPDEFILNMSGTKLTFCGSEKKSAASPEHLALSVSKSRVIYSISG